MSITQPDERNRAELALTQIVSLDETRLSKSCNRLGMILYDLADHIRQKGLDEAAQNNREYEIHGLCAVLGYNENEHWDDFKRSACRKGSDIFLKNMVHLNDQSAFDLLYLAMKQDGAVLIDEDGYMVHSGRRIGVDVDGIFNQSPSIEKTYDIVRDKGDGGTRHMAAIAASAVYPELLFVTVKSDHPAIRIIQGGYVVHSTVPEEVNHPQLTGNCKDDSSLAFKPRGGIYPQLGDNSLWTNSL